MRDEEPSVLIAPGVDHWTSQDPGFPWDLFGRVMCEEGMLESQMEDGMSLDPERVDWALFGRDPRRIIYLFSFNEQVAGFTMLVGKGVACVEIHVAFLPWARGPLAKALGMWTLAQMFSATSCHKIRAEIPRFNKAACRYAVEIGMSREGIISETFLSGGRMRDTVLYGVTRNAWFVQQSVRHSAVDPNSGSSAVH